MPTGRGLAAGATSAVAWGDSESTTFKFRTLSTPRPAELTAPRCNEARFDFQIGILPTCSESHYSAARVKLSQVFEACTSLHDSAAEVRESRFGCFHDLIVEKQHLKRRVYAERFS